MGAYGEPLASARLGLSGPRTPGSVGVYLSGREVIGVVMGGPHGLVAKEGAVAAPMRDTSVSGVVAATARVVEGLLSRLPGDDRNRVEVGLALSGHVNPETGTVVRSSDFRERERSWLDVPLAARVGEATGLQTHLINDANALALNSYSKDGSGGSDFAAVLVGEFGLGCGLIVNGSLALGERGVSGEIGHIPVALGQPQPCRCGGSHCLERVVTRSAIHAKFGDLDISADAESTGVGAAGIQIYESAGSALGYALVVLINLLNPSAIVIHADKELVDAPRFIDAAKETAKRCSFSDAGSSCRIYSRNLDPLDIARGAALYVESLQEP